MTKECLVKGLTYLGVAIGREYTSQECNIYYDFLKNYNYQDFIMAIKEVIKSRKPVPLITDLTTQCEKFKMSHCREIARQMVYNGVFKSRAETEKAGTMIAEGYIPQGYEKKFNETYMSMDNPAFEQPKEFLKIEG